MELLIIIFISLFFLGAVSFLRPSKKMKALSEIRSVASKEGFKIGSTAELRNKFKNWDPRVAIYQLKNTHLTLFFAMESFNTQATMKNV